MQTELNIKKCTVVYTQASAGSKMSWLSLCFFLTWPINTFIIWELALVKNGCSPLPEVIITHWLSVSTLEELVASKGQIGSSQDGWAEDGGSWGPGENVSRKTEMKGVVVKIKWSRDAREFMCPLVHGTSSVTTNEPPDAWPAIAKPSC